MTTQMIKIWRYSHGCLITIFSMHAYCSLTDNSASKVAKDHCTTQSNVRKGQRICHQLHKCRRESFSVSGNAPKVSSLGSEAAGSTTLSYSTSQGLSPWPSSASLQIVTWYWLFSFSSFVESLFMCLYTFAYKLKIVTRLPWEHYQILIFCVVVACSFPFLPLLRHYALLHPHMTPAVSVAWSTTILIVHTLANFIMRFI